MGRRFCLDRVPTIRSCFDRPRIMVLVILLACWVPARLASRTAPMVALCSE
jgi:hypothetical protein